MEERLPRRDFLKLGAAASGVVAGSGLLALGKSARAAETTGWSDALKGAIEDGKSKDYSPVTGQERQAIPSACWQCVSRDGIVCYTEDGRLVKIEGNPKLPRTNGKLCSKGQAGVNQVYDPDRVLFPMKRKGARGSGQWERITWDEALTELGGKLKAIKDAGTPEQFMFHYGRMKASSSKIIKSYFLKGFGTGTVAGHTSICEAAKWTAQELTWGKHYDVNDVAKSKLILNFGCNAFETHTNHLPLSQRLSAAVAGGTKLVTFDVRLSNTAARSTEWLPVKPGTDQAIVLAMLHVILNEDLAPQAGKDFIETWSDTDVASLKAFVNTPKDAVPDAYKADQPDGGYTPAWAEGLSGVPAAKITELAREYASSSPGSTIISYRGVACHYNGVQGERAILTLEALCGNIDTEGGRNHAVGASWSYHSTYETPSGSTSKLKILDGEGFPYPTHHADHRVLEMIEEGSHGRPDVYMTYCYTPVFANGDMQKKIDILKDETLIPYFVVCTTSYDESAALADLILPDATYLERWDWEDMVSMDHIPEYYIRQPAVAPLGEARDLKDVLYDLAVKIGDADLIETMKFKTAEEFVKAACNDTAGVKEAGGFEYMKANGAWYDENATPKYRSYLSEVDPGDAHLDEETGVYWNVSQEVDENGDPVVDGEGNPVFPSYRESGSYKKYVAQKLGDKVYKGFKPDKASKTGLFEIDSALLRAKDLPGFPAWMQAPEHKALGANDLILTTFKTANQIHSRSQNCKYLTELAHDNPAWINPVTAGALGVKSGDMVTLTRKGTLNSGAIEAGTVKASMEVAVRVTHGIAPGVIAISHHLGHWEYGRYASGNALPLEDADQGAHAAGDIDADLKWWNTYGYRGNWIVPNAGDPISGAQRIMDTVVTATKA